MMSEQITFGGSKRLSWVTTLASIWVYLNVVLLEVEGSHRGL